MKKSTINSAKEIEADTYSHCVTDVTIENVTVQEKGRRANFVNKSRKRYQKIRVDDCVIDQGPRADWIIRKINSGSVIVELKGKNINHAWDQILSTFKSDICNRWLDKKVGFLIVGSRVPNIGSDISKKMEEAKKLGHRLKITSSQTDFEIEDLF